jgi:predicted CxxxxCH...CXXCH cytochrome family protein
VTRLSTWLLATGVVASGACGFHIDRDFEAGDTIHPPGFADEDSDRFHGTYLREHGFPLADCRSCHGDDYHGGSVGVSCSTAECHAKGVEDCNTCHDSHPTTGKHDQHAFSCATCHPTRENARVEDHPGGSVDFAFSGLATADGAMPSFDHATATCSEVYCHGGRDIAWTAQGPLACDACHQAPPTSHAQFASSDTSACATCHGPDTHHIDGEKDLLPLGCDTCHGKGPLGAPPPGLDGATSGGAVGAHARHLDPTIADRIGKVADCSDCHQVPATLDAPGHLDATSPADVRLRSGESYDPQTRSCTVGCHWDQAPGPAWDDTSGAPRACDACHGFPPLKTRVGGPHPPAAADLDACLSCHAFDPASHVDGKVDFAW